MSENPANYGTDGSSSEPDLTASTPPAPTSPPPSSPWAQPAELSQAPGYGQPQGTGPQPHGAQPQAESPHAPQPPSGPPSYGPPSSYGQSSYGQPSYGAYGGQQWPGQATTTTTPARTAPWRRTVVATVAAAAIAVTAGGVGGFVGYALHPESGSSLQVTSGNRGGQAAAPVVDRSSLAKIAASVQPTVVVIQTGSGEGSGVIISGDGYIVTNNHVVATARGNTVQVTFNSGKTVSARIVGTDPKTDLAVVKADATGLTYATWGNSDNVQVGDTVLAIGSPLGLQGSVTAGIVSALRRTITVGGDQQSPFETPTARTTIGDAIQTDAPINPGNSGGALVNTAGEVVGINSAIATSGSTGNIGVGFAISSNRARSVAEQLIKGQKVSHPYLGVSVTSAQNGGAEVQRIASGSPAAKAGLRVGDVVTKIGDRAIAGDADLVAAVQSSTVGAKLTLTVVRGGSEQTLTVTVGEAP
ncbi:MAG TPA: trypsin-like peptidase domain-containing protein [Micromonosporaceae bacterium]